MKAKKHKRYLFILVGLLVLVMITGCGKTEQAENVDQMISEIGEVTLESEPKIMEAEEAVAGLTEDEVNSLDNMSVLTDARDTYDALYVDKLIDEMGDVTLSNADKVSEAQAAYNEISKAAKEKVTNVDKLKAAHQKLNEIAKEEADKALGRSFTADRDEVEDATWYTPKAMPEYIDVRSYVLAMVRENSSGSRTLCVRYNYTADEWIFWKTITVDADGVQYYVSPNYHDIVHDNDTEIWEYYEDMAINDDDVEMLKAIVNSDKTIVRFQGDNYYDDIIISDSDKASIKDALIAAEKWY